MKKIFLILSGILSFQFAMAQAPEIEWEKRLGGNGLERAYSIQQTTDGGYIVAGERNLNDTGNAPDNQQDFDALIVKLNETGSVEWEKTFGGPYKDVANSIKQTPDGGYIFTGYTRHENPLAGPIFPWVIKLDSAGNLQWQREYTTSMVNGSATAIQLTADGGYVLSGSGHPLPYYNHNFWIAKLDMIGAIEWEKFYGGNKADVANSVQQTVDGGYIVAGASESTDADVTGNHGVIDAWILKLSPGGGIEWKNSYGGSASDHAQSIIQTSDGGYIFAGITTSNDGDLSGIGDSYRKMWVVKLNTLGGIMWQKRLGYAISDHARSVQQTSDGGYIVAGKHTLYANGDAGIVKLDGFGNVEWERSIGNSSPEIAHEIIQTTDGGYIFAGESLSQNYWDFFIVKLKPEDYLSNEETSFHQTTLNLYPNPSTGNFTIKGSEKISTVKISDLSGKTVYTENISSVSKSFNLEGRLPSGIYIAEIQFENGTKETKKIIIRK